MDCAVLGKQAKEDDALLAAAMDDYKRVAGAIPKNAQTSDSVSKAISANAKLIEAMNHSIEILERGEVEGCFGKQAATWKQILEDLKVKRNEFNGERQVLLKAASVLSTKQETNNQRAAWKSFLVPSMQAFAVCVVQTKRRGLALDSKKPSPQDFALIMRGACNTEAFAIDAEQNKIEGWTTEDRREIKQALDSVRARAISEYSESFYGMR